MQQRHQLFRLIITLTILWLLLSGMFKPLLLFLGVISIAIVCFLSFNMKVLMHHGQPLYIRLRYIVAYCSWLIIEILKSNVAVLKQIFDPSLPIDPTLKAIPSQQKTQLGKVIYANSITLTPGTVAINIGKNGDILVHALNKAAMRELEEGDMGERVCQLEPAVDNTSKGVQ